MKKNLFFVVAMLVVGAMASCSQNEEFAAQATNEDAVVATTRSFGTKTPIAAIYVETNDTNPLNAGDYMLSNGTSFADIVEFFAANIHKETVNGVVRPTLYLNDKMTNLLENGGADIYVKPLQDKGIKVLLTVLGDWQDMGVSNMNDTQTTQFAQILAYAVEKYGLDGIGFDDEYANYSSTNSTSYSQIIIKLRALMPAGKLITVFDWGYTSAINAEARACIDYAYHGVFGYNQYDETPGIGLSKAKWSPISLNMGNTYTTSQRRTIGNNAAAAAEEGYGAMMFFNLRRSGERNPLPVFQAVAENAWDLDVTNENGNRAQDWTFVPAGYTITIDDVQ